MWKAADKRRDPSNVIAALGSYEIDQQVDIMPKDGLNLHSSSGAFNEEGAISESKMANSFELFGLQGIHAHCSGHASGRDLIEIVNAINTKKLLLADTEHPGLFRLVHGSKVIVPNTSAITA